MKSSVVMEKNVLYPMVTLRALEPEDLECLYEIENDMNLWNVGVTNVPYSKNVLLDYITQSTGDIYTDKQVRLMAENDRGEVVGMVDLMDFSPKHNRAELGLVVKNEYQGMGYAASILRKLFEYAKNIIHLHQIYAFVPKSNESCVKLLQTIEFQENMVLKEWLFDGEKYNDAIFFQRFL